MRNAIPPEPPLRVLIFGAGVLGSLYGARLAEAGNDVAVLARGRRLGELRAREVVLEDVRAGARTATPVRIVSELAPDDPYDVVVVLVQNAARVRAAAARRQPLTPNVLVMVSNPSGPGELIAAACCRQELGVSPTEIARAKAQPTQRDVERECHADERPRPASASRRSTRAPR